MKPTICWCSLAFLGESEQGQALMPMHLILDHFRLARFATTPWWASLTEIQPLAERCAFSGFAGRLHLEKEFPEALRALAEQPNSQERV